MLRMFIVSGLLALGTASVGQAQYALPPVGVPGPSSSYHVSNHEPSFGQPVNFSESDGTLTRLPATEIERQLAELRQEVQELRSARQQPPADAYLTGMSHAEYSNHAVADPMGDLQSQFNKLYDTARLGRYPNIQMNGVFQADAAFFQQDGTSEASFGDIQDGASFRRARLSAKGSVSETVNYFVQMDFGFFGRPTFTDVWVETVDLPVLGAFRIGQWKQPFSLEVVSSFRYTTFMERSLLFTPFTPFRHLGAGFYNHAEDLSTTWAASGFRTGQDQFGGSISDDGGWGTAERFTWLPFYDEASGGEAYLHLGLGHFYNNPPRDTYNFRTIPEIYVGENAPGVVGTSGVAAPGAFDGTPFFAKTGGIPMHDFNVLGSELLWVRGPWSLQSEAMVAMVNRINAPSVTLPGVYAQVGYFLTGEHRPYDRVAGAIDRVKPHENFFRVRTAEGVCHGTGAWEVAFRFSYLDLNDKNIRGGQLVDITAGLNWYLNPYTKLAWNYIHAYADDPTHGTSGTNIWAMRAQVDF